MRSERLVNGAGSDLCVHEFDLITRDHRTPTPMYSHLIVVRDRLQSGGRDLGNELSV
jgi:hypothetical protein